MSEIRTISAAELGQTDLRQALILDVRAPMEYSEKRLAAPSALAPLFELDPEDVERRNGILPDTPIFTLCVTDARARKAAAKLTAAGFTDVRVIEGGLTACQKAGLATTGQAQPKTGEVSASLDRQVRLVAGSLSLIFILLGIFVHRAFFLAALFIGAGQVFSGITNWCGMAMLLMRAPWNRATSCPIGGGKSPGAGCQ